MQRTTNNNTTLTPKDYGTWWKKGEKYCSVPEENVGNERVSSIYDKKTAPIKSQQHGFLNKTWTMTASLNFFLLAFTVLTGAICNSDLFNIGHSWILNFSRGWSLCYKDLWRHLRFLHSHGEGQVWVTLQLERTTFREYRLLINK